MKPLWVAALLLAGCGREGDPHYGGFYDVTATPATQACGNATFTFVGDVILIDVLGDVIETDWDGDYFADTAGVIDGNEFAVVWVEESADPIPCPATGAPSVVTTYENEWAGAFGNDSFESTLRQDVDDDCGVITSCTLFWNLRGARSNL